MIYSIKFSTILIIHIKNDDKINCQGFVNFFEKHPWIMPIYYHILAGML